MTIAENEEAVSTVWLLLYSQGGRWSAADVCDHLGAGMPRAKAHTALIKLHEGQRVRKYGEGRGQVTYGVDHTCKFPRAVTIRQFMQATADDRSAP